MAEAEAEVFTKAQKEVIIALGDAIVPSYEAPHDISYLHSALPDNASPAQRAAVDEYARTGWSRRPDQLVADFAHLCSIALSPTSLSLSKVLLSSLSTRAGCLSLTGKIGPFHKLTRQQREEAINAWARSPLMVIRKAGFGFKSIFNFLYFKQLEIGPKALGYPVQPPLGGEAPDAEADAGAGTDWKRDDDEAAEAATPHFAFKFEDPKPNDVLEADFVIIGSGSGGGVVSSVLTSKGYTVVVVDKGDYVPQSEMRRHEGDAYRRMYEREGILPSENSSVNILAGSTFGGGTTINWSASLKPRHFVRSAWADEHGCPYYLSPAFDRDLEAVCARMGVSDDKAKHNVPNQLFRLGAQRAGQPWSVIPQNTGGHAHSCGQCQFGCVNGHKQGGTVSWLRDAAETGKAKFVVGCHIERVILDARGRATGAVGKMVGDKGAGATVTFKANKGVVLSAGSIHSPAILLRTPGLKNRNVGRNLHIHPVTFVTAYFKQRIEPWKGSIMTMVSNAAEEFDAKGYGAKIEVIASTPAIHAGCTASSTSMGHRSRMLKYANSYTLICIIRDRDAGRVTVDKKTGRAWVDYSLSPHDQRSMTHALLAACDIAAASGAVEVWTTQTGMEGWKAPDTATTATAPDTAEPNPSTTETAAPLGLADPSYRQWRSRVAKAGSKPLWICMGSAHQMSSCRQGSSPRTSVCDPEGRVWGTKGLWVADASACPTATGVNPMVTTMGLSRGVARNILKDVGHNGGLDDFDRADAAKL